MIYEHYHNTNVYDHFKFENKLDILKPCLETVYNLLIFQMYEQQSLVSQNV